MTTQPLKQVHDIPELDAAGLRQFAFLMAGIVAVLFGLVLPWLFGFGFPLWPWIFGAVVGAWGLVAPSSLDPFYKLWMRFGLLLNKVVSPLVLSVIFFLAVTPMALVMKLIKRDTMRRDLEPEADSYRVSSEVASRDQMEKPF